MQVHKKGFPCSMIIDTFYIITRLSNWLNFREFCQVKKYAYIQEIIFNKTL